MEILNYKSWVLPLSEYLSYINIYIFHLTYLLPNLIKKKERIIYHFHHSNINFFNFIIQSSN